MIWTKEGEQVTTKPSSAATTFRHEFAWSEDAARKAYLTVIPKLCVVSVVRHRKIIVQHGFNTSIVNLVYVVFFVSTYSYRTAFRFLGSANTINFNNHRALSQLVCKKAISALLSPLLSAPETAKKEQLCEFGGEMGHI